MYLRKTAICVVDQDGKVVVRGTAPADPVGVVGWFMTSSLAPESVVHESGQLSTWLQQGMAGHSLRALVGTRERLIRLRKYLEDHVRGMLQTIDIRMSMMSQGH